MPKLKTHKGVKKVLNVRPGGTISIGKAGCNHMSGKKNMRYNRVKRAGSLLKLGDFKRLKHMI